MTTDDSMANHPPLSAEAKAYLMLRLRLPKLASVDRAPLMSWTAPTFVYVIGGERGPVKIGISVNPLKRLSELQVSHHEQLSVLCTIEGGTEHEQYLHRFYQRERLRGEWFRRSKRIREFIEECRFARCVSARESAQFEPGSFR